jgi:hypothetical protein
MTEGTKGGAQRAHSLRPRCIGGGSSRTATPIYHLQQYKKHLQKSCKIQNIRKQVTGKINEEKCKTEITRDKKWKLVTGQGFTCS